MFVRVTLVARRIRTAATFEAPDPWNGGRPASFNLDVYKMFPEHVRDPRDWRDGTIHTWGAADLFAIRSEVDGVERRLPAFLADLYREGAVPARELPESLRRVEAELAPKDFRTLRGRGALRVAMGALLVAAVALAGHVAVGPAVARERAAASSAIVTVDAWAARAPKVGERLVLNGMVPLEGREGAPAGLVVPPEAVRLSGASWFLGWTRAGETRRAVLFPARSYERGGAVELGSAVVCAPGEIGIAPALADLARRLPGLDVSSVTCSRWPVQNGAGTASVLRAGFLLLSLFGSAVWLGLFVGWLFSAPQRRRNGELSRRVLVSLGAPRVEPR